MVEEQLLLNDPSVVESNISEDYNLSDIKDGTMEDLYKLMRQQHMSEILPLTGVLSVLFVIGLVGNIIVTAVFSRSFIKHTSTYFMLTLSIVDLIICTVVLPGVLINNWFYPFKVDALCKIWEFIRMSTIPISALTLAAIGFDRYYLICMATDGPLSTSLAKVIIGVIVFVGVCLGIPPMLGVGVYQRPSKTGQPAYLGLCFANSLLISKSSLLEYWKVVVTIICLIFLFLIVTYILIFVKVYKQNRKWNTLKRNKVSPKLCDTTNKKDHQGPNAGHRWSRLRHLVNDLPARNPDRGIFFIRVRRSPPARIRTPPTASINAESDDPGVGDSGVGSTENSRISRTSSLNDNNKMTESAENMTTRQEFTYGRQRTAHIKTAKVLFIVTAVYFISYSPPLLISANLIPKTHVLLFYSYFIHSAANPIIYSFMNKKFRSEAKKFLCCTSKRQR